VKLFHISRSGPVFATTCTVHNVSSETKSEAQAVNVGRQHWWEYWWTAASTWNM